MRSRQLFASYGRKDRDIVSRLCDLLRIGGTRVFRDEDSIQPGKRWKAVLTETLQKSECVLVFWSANSAPSPAVREEYTTAMPLEKDIAPVLLDETPLVEELRHFQWIDCRSFVVVKPAPQDKPANIAGGAAGAAAGAVIGSVLMPGMGAVIGAALGAKLGTLAEAGTDLALGTLSDTAQGQLAELFAARVFDGAGRAEPGAAADGGGI